MTRHIVASEPKSLYVTDTSVTAKGLCHLDRLPNLTATLELHGTQDGKLIAASSWACTFQHTHFDVTSGTDQAEFARLLEQSLGRRPDLGDDP